MVQMEGNVQYAVSGEQLENMEGFDQDGQMKLDSFWNDVVDDIRKLTNKDVKEMELPIARIKRIMKLDEDVKMIAGETPVLFAKAAEIFIKELTLRAWIQTEESKRRTLQRNDISAAAGKCEMFDFLIDVLPREEAKSVRRTHGPSHNASTGVATGYVQHPQQVDTSAAITIPAGIGGDQMQQVVLQLPPSVLSALSPQKQQGALTIMQPLTLPGSIAPSQQFSVSDETNTNTQDIVSQVVALGGSDVGGGIIQLSATQLQSLLQPAALKQPTQQ